MGHPLVLGETDKGRLGLVFPISPDRKTSGDGENGKSGVLPRGTRTGGGVDHFVRVASLLHLKVCTGCVSGATAGERWQGRRLSAFRGSGDFG